MAGLVIRSITALLNMAILGFLATVLAREGLPHMGDARLVLLGIVAPVVSLLALLLQVRDPRGRIVGYAGYLNLCLFVAVAGLLLKLGPRLNERLIYVAMFGLVTPLLTAYTLLRAGSSSTSKT